jgi:hypothetical protein
MESYIYVDSFCKDKYLESFIANASSNSKKFSKECEFFFDTRIEKIKNVFIRHLAMKDIQLSAATKDCLKLIPKKINEKEKTALISSIEKIISLSHAEATKAAKKVEKILETFEDEKNPFLKRASVFKDDINKFIINVLNNSDAGTMIKNLESIGIKRVKNENVHVKFSIGKSIIMVPYHGKSGFLSEDLRHKFIGNALGKDWNEIFRSYENKQELKRLGFSVAK